jgi:hypothetical protein
MILTLEQITASLQDRRAAVVAKATGIHYNTVRKLRDGAQINPTYSTLVALSNYLTNGCPVRPLNG